MATIFIKLQNLKGLRGNVKDSIEELLYCGFTHTGMSSRRRKSIWTDKVSEILQKLNIAHICGNDAPRGGANGEFVKITSPSFIKESREYKKMIDEAIKKREEAEKQREEEIRRRQEEGWKQRLKNVEKNLDKFKSIDYDDVFQRLKKIKKVNENTAYGLLEYISIISYSYADRIQMYRIDMNSVAHILMKITNLPQNICQTFCQSLYFLECLTGITDIELNKKILQAINFTCIKHGKVNFYFYGGT